MHPSFQTLPKLYAFCSTAQICAASWGARYMLWSKFPSRSGDWTHALLCIPNREDRDPFFFCRVRKNFAKFRWQTSLKKWLTSGKYPYFPAIIWNVPQLRQNSLEVLARCSSLFAEKQVRTRYAWISLLEIPNLSLFLASSWGAAVRARFLGSIFRSSNSRPFRRDPFQRMRAKKWKMIWNENNSFLLTKSHQKLQNPETSPMFCKILQKMNSGILQFATVQKCINPLDIEKCCTKCTIRVYVQKSASI